MNVEIMIRTRFAPSPTGYLHLGSARTALYCYLYAKKMNGQFILRIEDTDRERSTEEAIHAIIDAMEWMGLDWSEGPFYQMKRLSRYHEIADQLEKSGHAYRCYCTKERLEKVREELLAKKEKPRYDGFCRHRQDTPKDEPYVVRFKNPVDGQVEMVDAVHGHIVIQNSELDDVILLRSDGVPTYNFGVVVDDIDMKITHVIRGDDHIANTPRQINIFRALGAPPPKYAHLSTILGPDGKRLSKRHGAVSVQHYRAEGILPEALLNYLVRLGWSHGDQEIFSLDEMIQLFDLKGINKAAACFNPEKLLWLNQHYLKERDPKTLTEELKWHFKECGINISDGPLLEELIVAQRERVKTLRELAEKSRYFFEDFQEYDKEAYDKNITPEVIDALKWLRVALESLSTWTKENIHQAVNDTATRLGLKLGKIAQPLRIAVTGNTISPPIDITLSLMGKKKVLERLDKIINAGLNS